MLVLNFDFRCIGYFERMSLVYTMILNDIFIDILVVDQLDTELRKSFVIRYHNN